jgi:hypothetical protein
MALAWVNFLKQRVHVLQLDYGHITADRIVAARGLKPPNRLRDCFDRRRKARMITSLPRVAVCEPTIRRTQQPPRLHNSGLN